MRIVNSAQTEGDLSAARAFAVDVVDKVEGIREGLARPDIVLPDGGTFPRDVWLHGQAARLLLNKVLGDHARLQAIATACDGEVATSQRRLHPRQLATLETAAVLARQALGLLDSAGVTPDTGPGERAVVLEHLWQGYLRHDTARQRWAYRRRRARARRHDTTEHAHP